MIILNRIITFLKEVKLEMKKINWLSRKQTLTYTLIVIGLAFVVAVFLGILDVIFMAILERFIL